jgi:hypothetical protein
MRLFLPLILRCPAGASKDEGEFRVGLRYSRWPRNISRNWNRLMKLM